MKIFVTGATGFIGIYAVARLVESGHQVRMLVRDKEKANTLLQHHHIDQKSIEIAIGDITKKETIAAALPGIDCVVHCAAMVNLSRKERAAVENTNVNGTENVLECFLSANISKMIYISSVTCLYGSDIPEINEEAPLGMSSDSYTLSKICSEQLVRKYQTNGANIISLYPVGVIGPQDHSKTAITAAIKAFSERGVLKSTSGIQFIDVRDVADAINVVCESSTNYDKYILASNYYTWSEFANLMDSVAGKALNKMYVPPKVFRLLGRICDFIGRFSDTTFPITYEIALYHTKWIKANSNRFTQEFRMNFRTSEESLMDVIYEEEKEEIKNSQSSAIAIGTRKISMASK